VLWYAPDSVYGRPDDLKALIDEAHLRGLMVFLDVVITTSAPKELSRPICARLFTRRRPRAARSITGAASAPSLENALYWLREYRSTGRLDAARHPRARGNLDAA
jgi:1,4-alpha-glucan branching enzyme